MLAGEVTVAVAAHALAETFATLTALPVSPQVTTLEAERLIREGIVAYVEVVPLGAADYDAVIKRVAGLGLVSGAVYDALHVHAAEKAGCEEIVTFNGRDFRRFPLQPPTRLVVL
jgi:predicted nucleic acid-binding protein